MNPMNPSASPDTSRTLTPRMSWRRLTGSACALGLSLAMVAPVPADEGTPPAPAAAPGEPTVKVEAAEDALTHAVDPYEPGRQRQAFLRAAGVDSELSAEEFEADAKQGVGYARTFDSWPALRRFDANANGTIDWFEADQHRRALRKQVLELFDRNRDNRLLGPERDEALKAIAAGKLPKLGEKAPNPAPGDAPKAEPEAPKPGKGPSRGEQRRKEFIAKWDKDGDGKLSDEEKREMATGMIFEGRQRQVRKWDENGDGKLDADERAKVMEDPGDQWWLFVDDEAMKHFDNDGDGKLSQDEAKSIVSFGQKMEGIGKGWEKSLLDANGDGEVSGDERTAFRQRMQMVGVAMLPKLMKWGDTNGDGRVELEEQMAVAKRAQKAATANFQKWTQRFDANNDGRLDEQEREKLATGIDTDFKLRVNRHDTNGDGKLSNDEVASMAEELAAEWGIKPSEQDAQDR